MSFLSVGSIILGIIIWFIFNKYVTRFYFGASFLNIIVSIIAEFIVCIFIAGIILSLIGSFLGSALGALGSILLFIIKAVLVIAGILLVIGGVYAIYCKIKGKPIGTAGNANVVKENANYVTDSYQTVKMSYCAKCGKQIQSTIQFCNYCGHPVINNEQESDIADTGNSSSSEGISDSSISEQLTDSENIKIISSQNSKMKFCYKCGQTLESSVRFCSKCGSDQAISDIITIPPKQADPIIDTNSIIDDQGLDDFSNCNSSNQIESEKKVFCAFCGSSISAGVKHCNFCGKPNTYIQNSNKSG